MKKGDFVVIFVVALLVIGSLCTTLFAFGKSDSVTVSVAGKEIATYPLDRDFETVIKTEYGENTLVIKDGIADITAADCQNNDCVHQNKISKNGEIIACLPHKLIITVTSAEQGENDLIS